METADVDVLVIGGGNAALSAAHSAAEHCDRVLVAEKAPEAWAGGNSYFSAGAFRTAVSGLEEICEVLDPSARADERLRKTELPPYSAQDFRQDLDRLTRGRCDATLADLVTGDSFDTIRWLRDKGLRWELLYPRQSFQREDGTWRFWGGLYLGTVDGGKGLIAQHHEAARREGVELWFESPAVSLLHDGERVHGAAVARPEGRVEVRARAVVLASGGFESDPRLRSSLLGPGWDLAKVRGTPYNTGEMLMQALELGAKPTGHWSGCHAVAWEAAASTDGGDLELTNLLTKQSYPLGLVVNANGDRFVDEGADFRNYTYAKYGAAILEQPGAIAYQLFDGKTEHLLRQDEYRAPGTSAYSADSVPELAERIGIDPTQLKETVERFNASVEGGPFDPSRKDGLRTVGITPPKSNWALPLDEPPFTAYAVTCGITFTFGGLRVDADAGVQDRSGRLIPGLFAAGELVGGLFFHNYPGGSGLTAGSVLGRRAGRSAATRA